MFYRKIELAPLASISEIYLKITIDNIETFITKSGADNSPDSKVGISIS